jgi:microcompartment protein CcmL/EutN
MAQNALGMVETKGYVAALAGTASSASISLSRSKPAGGGAPYGPVSAVAIFGCGHVVCL